MTAALTVWSPKAAAQTDTRADIAIAAGTLPEALAELAREADVSIGTPGPLPRLATRRVVGRMSVTRALARLLAGSGYVARQVGERAWRIEQAPAVRRAVTPPVPARESVPDAEPGSILVQATKRDLRLALAPVGAAVTIIDPLVAGQPRTGSAWLSGQVEGLILAGPGPGRNHLFLRGVADSPFGSVSQSTVAVLLDDARLTYEAPDPDIRLVDVARVELLKGPQGSLYGTGALGGIYHIVTNRAEPGTSQLSFSTTGQILSHGAIGAGGSIVANLPLTPDTAALRLVAYADTTPGWIDTGRRHNSNGSTALGLRAGLGIDPGGGWRIDATGFAQWLNSRDSSYVYRSRSYDRPAQLAEPHDNDLIHGSLRLARRGPVNIVMSSGFTHHAIDNVFDATQGAAGQGVTDPQTLQDRAIYQVWDSEARITGARGSVDWLAGLSHVEARHRGARVLAGLADVATLDTVRRSSIESAVFGEAALALLRKLQVTIGARLSRDLVEEELTQATETAETRHARIGLTPTVAMSYEAGPAGTVYVRYGSAFRQGGISVDAAGVARPLDGDELNTVEAGWRATLGALAFDLGLYHSRWSHLQSDILLPGGRLDTINAGSGVITGAELSASIALGQGWTIDGGGMAQSALLVRNQTGLVLDDRHLPAVPSWTVRAALARNFDIGAWHLGGKATMRIVGPAHLTFDPALDRAIDRTIETGLAVQARKGVWTLAIEAENVLGEAYDTFAFGNPLRIFTQPEFIPQTPRTVLLTLSLRP